MQPNNQNYQPFSPVYLPRHLFASNFNLPMATQQQLEPQPSTSSYAFQQQFQHQRIGEEEEFLSQQTEENENEEDSFHIESQNILDSLKKKPVEKKISHIDNEMLIELVRSYPCIWNVKLNVHKDALKKDMAWNKIKESHGGNFAGEQNYLSLLYKCLLYNIFAVLLSHVLRRNYSLDLSNNLDHLGIDKNQYT